LFLAFSLHDFGFQCLAILAMLGILSILIIVHECGHFFVARLFGFQTPVFGFGLPFFGPSWSLGHKWGTEFKLHALLLGGYVSIPELGDESAEQNFGGELKPFKKFPIWQRILVAFAGPGANILFAYVVMALMLLILGEPCQSTIVGALPKENPIAAQAGVLANDEIVNINGKPVLSPSDAVQTLSGHKSEKIIIDIRRKVNDEIQSISLPMTTNADGKVGMVLTVKGPVRYQKVDIDGPRIFSSAAKKMWSLTALMLDSLRQMVVGLWSHVFSNGKGANGQALPGIQDIHGVFAVVKLGSEITKQDWNQLFLFTILISLDLAIVNLLPWPPLDGSHIAFSLVEGIQRKPVNPLVQAEMMKWGTISLLLLMALITVNDITAWISGKLDFKVDKGAQTVKQVSPKTP
jgi:regulator of sigma E protease